MWQKKVVVLRIDLLSLFATETFLFRKSCKNWPARKMESAATGELRTTKLTSMYTSTKWHYTKDCGTSTEIKSVSEVFYSQNETGKNLSCLRWDGNAGFPRSVALSSTRKWRLLAPKVKMIAAKIVRVICLSIRSVNSSFCLVTVSNFQYSTRKYSDLFFWDKYCWRSKFIFSIVAIFLQLLCVDLFFLNSLDF